MTASQQLKTLAACLPDIPRWLETRSMLLAEKAEVTGLSQGEAAEFVARDLETGLLAVAGRPDKGAIRAAAVHKPALPPALICQLDNRDRVSAALPDWSGEEAVIHLSAGMGPLLPAQNPDLLDQILPVGSPLLQEPPVEVRFVWGDEISRHEDIPEDLRKEFALALLRSPIAAAFADGRAVSFCYAPSETETLWDVSVDTLDHYRGKGYAVFAVAKMIEHMYEKRKRPVWGAMQSNTASLRLASRLGFKAVDRLVVMRPR